MTSQADTSGPMIRAASAAEEARPDADAMPTEDRRDDDGPVLEMRQVAGLTAGSVMLLHEGSFQFRESDKDVGFSLVVNGEDDVVVLAGSAAALVDEIPVVEPTPLGDAVLNVGSACFTVRTPRPEPTNSYLLAELETARTPPGAIPVPDFRAAVASPAQPRSSRFGALFSGGSDEEPQGLDALSWEFLESVRDVRSIVAERHRRLHPNPEELRNRLQRLEPGLWDRTVEHPLFGRFPIAYSTIPWEPRFDAPERIPELLYQPIQEMSCLPWVPVTANLLNGPLGIVGARAAVLACARNAVLALACLTAPDDIEFSIVTAQGLIEDWTWTSSLPNSLFPQDGQKYCVAVADGMSHFEGAGFTHERVRNNEMGLIVLADSLDELPEYCGTVLELMANGECRVTNHLGEQVAGTPIGVAANYASATAAMVKEAIGDGPTDDEAPDPRFPAKPEATGAAELTQPIEALQSVDPVDPVDPDESDPDDGAIAEATDEDEDEGSGPHLVALDGGAGDHDADLELVPPVDPGLQSVTTPHLSTVADTPEVDDIPGLDTVAGIGEEADAPSSPASRFPSVLGEPPNIDDLFGDDETQSDESEADETAGGEPEGGDRQADGEEIESQDPADDDPTATQDPDPGSDSATAEDERTNESPGDDGDDEPTA
ncbi:MAG: hypothetical protein AAF547_20590 [Actinomycetota bacterium]